MAIAYFPSLTDSEIELAIMQALSELKHPFDPGIVSPKTAERAKRQFIDSLSDPENANALRVLESL